MDLLAPEKFLGTSAPQILLPGILGGLGPLAHIEFERRLLSKRQERSQTKCDQDYPSWMLFSASNIPDRSMALRRGGPSPLPALLYYTQLLQKAGSNFLIVPCNTAHAFYPQVQSRLEIPWLHLMQHTADFIRETYPTAKRIGILATDGTLYAKLYQKSLANVGLSSIEPRLDTLLQQQVMQSIYAPGWGIKTTGLQISENALNIISQAIEWLQQQNADLIIAGCTELSVAFSQLTSISIPWVDPLDIIADLSLDLAYGISSMPKVLSA